MTTVSDCSSSGILRKHLVTTTQGNDLLLDQRARRESPVRLPSAPTEMQAYHEQRLEPLGRGTGSATSRPASTAGTETMTRNSRPTTTMTMSAVVAVKAYTGRAHSGYSTTTIYAYAANRLREPRRGDLHRQWRLDNDLFLRRQRQPRPSRRLELHVGLSQPHARQRLQQLHDDVRLRSIRRPRAADRRRRRRRTIPISTTRSRRRRSEQTPTPPRTNYIWNGDTLLATIDQKLYNGTATGSPITRYIHPDHLGSTNAVTDQNGNLVQLMDYYPYGATRVLTSTYPTNEKRQYIGQFSDAQTNLNYLNARLLQSTTRAIPEVRYPVALGDPKQQNLQNPQSLNVYSYSEDNPIIKSDPSGKCAGPLIVPCIFIIGAGISSGATYAGDVLNNISNGRPNPYTDNLSTTGSYAIGDLTGGASLAFLEEYRLYASGLTFASSLAQDDANGDPRDYRKAGIAAGTTFLTGVAFEGAIGRTAAKQITARVGGEVFGTANTLVLQNFFNTYKSPLLIYIEFNSSTPTSSSKL